MTDLYIDEITLIVRGSNIDKEFPYGFDTFINRGLGYIQADYYEDDKCEQECVNYKSLRLTYKQVCRLQESLYEQKYKYLQITRIILHPDMEYLVKQGTVFEYINEKLIPYVKN